jgi:hypothetical protein
MTGDRCWRGKKYYLADARPRIFKVAKQIKTDVTHALIAASEKTL